MSYEKIIMDDTVRVEEKKEPVASSSGVKLWRFVNAHEPLSLRLFRRFTASMHLGTGMITRYRSKVLGPLMDRIDIHIDVTAVPSKEPSNEYAGEKSKSINRRVSEARRRQLKRFSSDKIFTNGQMKTST